MTKRSKCNIWLINLKDKKQLFTVNLRQDLNYTPIRYTSILCQPAFENKAKNVNFASFFICLASKFSKKVQKTKSMDSAIGVPSSQMQVKIYNTNDCRLL